MQQEEATDAELADAIAAKIEQVRREYIEGVPAATEPTQHGTETNGPATRDRHGEAAG